MSRRSQGAASTSLFLSADLKCISAKLFIRVRFNKAEQGRTSTTFINHTWFGKFKWEEKMLFLVVQVLEVIQWDPVLSVKQDFSHILSNQIGGYKVVILVAISCCSDEKCEWHLACCIWDPLPLSWKVPALPVAESLDRDACKEWLFCTYAIRVLFKCLVLAFMPQRRRRDGGKLMLETVDLKPPDIAFRICNQLLSLPLFFCHLPKWPTSIISKPTAFLSPTFFSFHPPPFPQKNPSSCVRAELCVCEMAAI